LLWRLETMALMSDVDLPVAHVRDQVASAIDLVVHMARLRDGRRVVMQVASVDGLRDGNAEVTELFAFAPREGPRGAFVSHGATPEIVRILSERGEDVPASLFERGIERPAQLRAAADD
jgi:pilus assembly protein CpaF